MKLFEGRRVSVYFQGGQLRKEKKTPRRFWLMKLAITVNAADAHACDGSILSNFQQIEARSNLVDQISMGSTDAMNCVFYDHRVGFEPVLNLAKCFLSGLYMTHDEGLTELWMTIEHDLTDQLHTFVRGYVFTRFFVEFLPRQATLPIEREASASEGESVGSGN